MKSVRTESFSGASGNAFAICSSDVENLLGGLCFAYALAP